MRALARGVRGWAPTLKFVAPVQVQELSGTGVFRHANINPLALQSAKSVGVRLELGQPTRSASRLVGVDRLHRT